MRKKSSVILLLSFLSVLLFGCGSKDVSEYVDVSFKGYDSYGEADVYIDEERLITDLFDVDADTDFVDDETLREIMTILAAIKIKVENEENLSNGDKIKVTVNVDQEKTKKIKGGTKEFKVSGLDEPKKLSTEAAEKHLVPVFSGVSGRGTVKFENTFSDELRNVYFTAKNNGKLSNGDEVELEIDDSFKKSLIHHGYVLDETFEPKYKVKNLHVVADQAKDIANLEDIKRIINEEMQKQYGKSFIYSYKVKHENYMYRKFEPGEVDASKWTESGNLVGLYTVSRYSGDNLDSQYVVVRGFKNIYLDKNNKANIADIMRNKINQSMDSSYSLETVVQMYEGYGYEIIE